MEGCVSPCIIGSVSTIFADFGDFGGKFPTISSCQAHGIKCKTLKFQRLRDVRFFYAAVKPPTKPLKFHHFCIFLRFWWDLLQLHSGIKARPLNINTLLISPGVPKAKREIF